MTDHSSLSRRLSLKSACNGLTRYTLTNCNFTYSHICIHTYACSNIFSYAYEHLRRLKFMRGQKQKERHLSDSLADAGKLMLIFSNLVHTHIHIHTCEWMFNMLLSSSFLSFTSPKSDPKWDLKMLQTMWYFLGARPQ